MTRTVAPATVAAPRTAPGLSQWIPLPYGRGPMAWAHRDPLGFLTDNARRFGPVFRYRAGPFLYHLLSRPEHVKYVLQDHYRNYPRSWLYRFTRLVGGNGLVSTEGDVWRRQRRMVQPAFSHQRIAALARPMTEATAGMLGAWAARYAGTGRVVDVAAEMIGLTLTIVGKTLLGVDLGGETDALSPAIAELLAYLEHRITVPLSPPAWVPTPRNRRYRRALGVLDRVVYDIIEQRRPARDGPGGGNDLLSMMLSLRDEETDERMSDRELRDQVVTFIGAGHETTAVALAWVWYLLSQHPDAGRRVREEVAGALNGRVPTVQDLPNLAYTRRVIEESLRLYPPVYGVVRDVVAEDEIGGFRIPAGSSVVLSQYVTHRHPAVWADPERFDPDRFTPANAAGRPRFAWFPFIGGPHQCIGQEFALMEATLIVSMVVQRFRLTLSPGARVEPKAMLSLRPRDGVPMMIETA